MDKEVVKHTPGEWRAEIGGVIRAIDPKVGIRCKRGVAQPQVALVVGLHEDRPEGERDANAKLIAASPDLLAGCKRANRLLDNLLKAVPWGDTFDLDIAELNAVLLDLPRAIAKAEN